jgi:diaminohydroxyphosphoribosylaminopyrimidine deaminase/5-amino-6-(5-phosphoribosylamino)uracil reductase
LSADPRHLAAALALAERGRAMTAPAPCVGCVIVRNDHVVGRGWSQPGGRPHAEAMALAEAGSAAQGATAYVTLEPCAHHSMRGPKCAEALIEAGVACVVAAISDPDPRTDGRGFAMLRDAGITVRIGDHDADARRSMAGFLTRQALGRPAVTLKLATSLDGCIAMADGSARWITGDAARRHGHLERARAEAIVVGRGTVVADDPGLDVRLPGLEQRSPARCILSRDTAAPEGWHVLPTPAAIAALPGDHVLVEGGAGAAAAFLAADLVDRLLLYRAPIMIGRGLAALGDIGLADLGDAHGRWRLQDSRPLGADRLEIYERVR